MNFSDESDNDTEQPVEDQHEEVVSRPPGKQPCLQPQRVIVQEVAVDEKVETSLRRDGIIEHGC